MDIVISALVLLCKLRCMLPFTVTGVPSQKVRSYSSLSARLFCGGPCCAPISNLWPALPTCNQTVFDFLSQWYIYIMDYCLPGCDQPLTYQPDRQAAS